MEWLLLLLLKLDLFGGRVDDCVDDDEEDDKDPVVDSGKLLLLPPTPPFDATEKLLL